MEGVDTDLDDERVQKRMQCHIVVSFHDLGFRRICFGFRVNNDV